MSIPNAKHFLLSLKTMLLSVFLNKIEVTTELQAVVNDLRHNVACILGSPAAMYKNKELRMY